ncbi:MAG: thioredoxin family protein [Parcubacteria group bacterium]|nr:thioredoxin family protein [Parcubacteria group bacterium]
MPARQTLGLLTALIVIAGIIVYLERQNPERPGASSSKKVALETNTEKRLRFPEAVELAGISGYLNTAGKEIKIADLIGKKVILVDFWTYSCINCQRTLPYLTAWHTKYRTQGLEIVGVHTPEFDFEKDPENVQAALEKWDISYPVVQDNDYATWRAYGNRYWPRKYLIDIDGYIVYDHIGEGGYRETERKIQELLSERMERRKEVADVKTDVVYPRVDLDSGGDVGSPEIYFGAWRNEYLANGERGAVGVQTFDAPETIQPNALYLVGDWDIEQQYAESASHGARIIFKYSAQDVFAVASASEDVVVDVTRDGRDIGREGGGDFGVGGLHLKTDERLYRIIEDTEPGEHVLEITLPPGVRFYAFTFG